jgi:flagellar motor switch protein FliG
VQLKRVSPELKEQVLREFVDSLQDSAALGGSDYARVLLEQVVGENRAKGLLTRLTLGGGPESFRSLRSIPASQVANHIKHERPQVVALVLGHLPTDHAAEVLSLLPQEQQGEVVLRLTTMQPTDPDIVRHVDQLLVQRLSAMSSATLTEVGGNDSVVHILNNVDRSTERNILDFLTEADERIANEIKERMFVFEDIPSLDDRAIQIILRDVPQDDLRLALKGIAEQAREVFYRNMSQRAAETLKEDLEASGPVKLKDVEAAQGRIAGIARQLDEAGEISVRDNGEELVA